MPIFRLLPRLIALNAQLDEALEFGIGGLKKILRVIPSHLDKRGITAVTSASAYKPTFRIFPGKGIPVGGMRAIREPYRPGMVKSKRQLQLVDDANQTQITITRPRKKKWSIETLSNAGATTEVPTEKLVHNYKRLAGFEPDRALIKKQSLQYKGITQAVSDQEAIEKTGGLPMIRRPSSKR